MLLHAQCTRGERWEAGHWDSPPHVDHSIEVITTLGVPSRHFRLEVVEGYTVGRYSHPAGLTFRNYLTKEEERCTDTPLTSPM